VRRCSECLNIARELNEKLSEELVRSRKSYEAESVTHEQFIGRLRGMTEGDLLQMAERLSESALGQARRKVAEHHALTGHWAPLRLTIGEWTA
jgi:hypothetical protein